MGECLVSCAEAMEIKWGVQFALSRGIIHLIVETDCLDAQNARLGKEVEQSYLCRSFIAVKFTHLKREENTVAHVIAKKLCRHNLGFHVWLEDLSRDLLRLIVTDCAC